MTGVRNAESVRIGLVADEPIRLEGLSSVFDHSPSGAQVRLVPVYGSLRELLGNIALKFLLVDMHSSSAGMKTLETIRRTRPDIRSIVIGPPGNEELIMQSILGGARAYVDTHAGPETVRQAVEVATDGSIWAPRRVLSRLIDRLAGRPDYTAPLAVPELTLRERQVLELILKARSNREIAAQLGIEERTVRAHLGRLMRKAGVDNRIKLSMSELSHSLLRNQHSGRM